MELNSEQHSLFRKSVAQWVTKELTPYALEWDETEDFPKEIFKTAGRLGFLGMRLDPAYGGSGLDYSYSLAFVEELAKANNMGVGMALIVQAEIATPIINELGSLEQKELFLKPAIAGDQIAALGISEPDCGSDVANLKTTARLEGDDFVINGSKMWITNGTRADWITLAVRTGVSGHKGISLLTLPTDVRGYAVANKLKKVGNLSSDTAILYFDNCRIPKRYLLGELNHGFYYIMTNFQGERLSAAISATATMEQILNETLRYAKERNAFGSPLLHFQVWRHKLVEHLTTLKAGQCLVYHAASLFNNYLQKKSPLPPQDEISMAKLFACDAAQKVAYDCQQLFGGMGYVSETPVARLWRDLRLLTIGGGTSEIMKEILGKSLLK